MKSISLNIHLPDMVNLTENDLKIALASKLYGMGELSLGQAADVAGLSKRTFVELLGKCGVSLFSQTVDDLRQDVLDA